MMIAIIYRSEGDSASNGGGSTAWLCVDRKVHIKRSTSWYDQTGCETEAYDLESWGDLGPCDGSCLPKMELPQCAEKLIQRFLESGGKECSGFSQETPRYPWAKYEEMLNQSRESE